MTELLIDGQRVVLPSNFSTTVVEENPFYTKNGKYTLDVLIYLENEPQNKKIYKHRNRFNSVNEIPRDRSAVMIVNNEVILNGTENILEWTDKFVRLQILSGNSDLNFLIGGDLRLRDLDLGIATPFIHVDQSKPEEVDIAIQVFQSLKKTYPERDWHLLPYYAGIDDHDYRIHGNRFTLQTFDPDDLLPEEEHSWGDRDAYYVPWFSGQVPQPYLCFIIKQVIESKEIGYTLIYNAIAEHDLLKNAYIVHGIQTMDFAKMLPVWTVSEFLSKIELQFDCTFVVNADDKTIRLLFNYQNNFNYENNKRLTTLEALDDFTVEYDKDNKLLVQTSNVAYSLDSDDYYAFMAMDPRIMEKAERVYYNTLPEMVNFVMDSTDKHRFEKIFTDGYDQFIAFRTGETVGGQPEVISRRVNSFVPLMNNPDSKEIDQEFDIIPASMVYSWEPGAEQAKYYFQFPKAGNYDPLFGYEGSGMPVEKPIFDIQSIVEGEISLDEDTSYTKMRLAIFQGLVDLDLTVPNADRSRFPITFVESLAEYFEETGIIRFFGPIGRDPFRLSNFDREIYSLTNTTDTTHTYKVPFLSKGKVDVTSRFVIRNKAFSCVKIERTVTALGFNTVIRGEFYPVYANENKN